MLMNSDFIRRQARRFAERVAREASEPAAQVQFAWQFAYLRPPESHELQAACAFLARQVEQIRSGGQAEDAERQALTNLCQSLLSSNEFLYVD
jgi:hypothetical protein